MKAKRGSRVVEAFSILSALVINRLASKFRGVVYNFLVVNNYVTEFGIPPPIAGPVPYDHHQIQMLERLRKHYMYT